MSSRSQVEAVFRQCGVGLAYAFGSHAEVLVARFVHDQPIRLDDPLADLDLGVVFTRGLPGEAERRHVYASLYNSLSEVFSERLDLVFLQEAHSVFQAAALAGHCLYAESETFQEDYEHRVLARAADFRPVLEAYLRESLDELRRGARD